MNNRTIKIKSTSTTIRFKYNGEGYTYLWESNPQRGFDYIEKNGITIYGPYEYQCTDEGREVYEVFRKNHLNKPHGNGE